MPSGNNNDTNNNTEATSDQNNISDDVTIATHQQTDYVTEKVNKPFMYTFFRIQTFICIISLALVICAQSFLPSHHYHRPMLINILVRFYIVTASIVGLVVELEVLSEWLLNKFFPIFR